VFEVFGETHDDLWVFDEQLVRWSKVPLTARQRVEVDRLILQQRRMREVVEEILALADDLRATTIEAVLAKSDFDLGLEAVFGGRILDQRPTPPPPSERAREAARTQRLNLPKGVLLCSTSQGRRTTRSPTRPWGRLAASSSDPRRTNAPASMRRWRVRRPIRHFDRRRDLVGLVFKEVERVISYGLPG